MDQAVSIKEIQLNIENNLISFSAVNQLYTICKEIVPSAIFAEIESQYAGDISRVLYYYGNEISNPEYRNILATLEIQAITLRLSRHHIKRARVINNIANFFKDILAYISLGNNEIVELRINNAEFIDRPSMMIINLINRLSSNHNFSIRLIYNREVSEDNSLSSQLLKTRLQLCKAIALRQEKPSQIELKESDFSLKDASYNEIVLNASLIEQNFELSILILNKLLKDHDPFISKQLSYRYLGVIEANLGQYDNAIEFLNKAIDSSESVLETCCNKYIKSLCLTKRKQNISESLQLLEEAITLINTQWEDTPEFKHEKAWLINGLSLAKTIRASKLPKKEKEKELQEIIKHEIEAYTLLKNETNLRIAYLKFNLLANIAFLLEILNEYEKAIDFWKRAFGPLLNDGEYNDAEKALSYRIGLLYIKLGDLNKASEYLERANNLSNIEKNEFHLLNIYFAQGFLEAKKQQYSAAEDFFIKGRTLSGDLKDFQTEEEFKEALSQLNTNLEISRFPHIKLRSYVPYIDLSFVPEIDLNKALTHKGGEKIVSG
ncbi:hypothetical protein [Mesobacillus thioparans]|uniref:hypothetical protein n=1 Tax=Mesobacillus thioparans TaxID=370439 RepID=UPI0039F0FF15